MLKNSLRFLTFAFGIALVGCATVPPKPPGLNFSPDQLAGSWAESGNSQDVCTDNEVRYRFEFAPDGKRLTIRLSRLHPTEIGDREEVGASIVESTDRSLTISYEAESRLRTDGTPLQWQLVVVAPGVYRWRETSWPIHNVNVMVGVKCGT